MKIIITLPYPLPTWNRILAMHHWERKKLRDWIHASMLQLSVIEKGNTIQTEYHVKQSWMELYGPDYYQMIRPKKSKVLYSKALSVKKKKKR